MSDLYFDKLQLLLPMKGSNNGTIFNDYSRYKRYVYRSGAVLPYTKTDQYVHTNYGSSGYFPTNSSGQSSHLRVNGISIGTQPFTVSFWAMYTDTGTRILFESRYASEAFSAISNNASGGFRIEYDKEISALYFRYGATGSAISTTYNVSPYTPFQNAVKYGWGHFEISRDSSNDLRMFMNGKLFKTQNGVSNSFNYSSCTLGGYAVPDNDYAVYMTDFALHVGVALHTADFTHELHRRTGYALSGSVADDAGVGAVRSVIAHPRLAPEALATTQSDVNGDYAFSDLVDDDHYVVCLDDAAGTDYNALILDRITPT